MSELKDRPRTGALPSENHADASGNAPESGGPDPAGAEDEGYFPEDERSPLEEEDDHSYADFDLRTELDDRLGASGGPELAARPPLEIAPDDGHQTRYFPEDECSPPEHEDDHSYTDFDLQHDIETAAKALSRDGGGKDAFADDDAILDDERAPLEHEDDHSSTDFDLNAEIESRLGPAQEDDPLIASREAGKAYLEMIREQEPTLDPEARAAAARNADAIGVDDDSWSLADHETDTDDEGDGLVMRSGHAATAGENAAGPPAADAPDEAEQPPPLGSPPAGSEDQSPLSGGDEEEEKEGGGDPPMTLRDHLRELRKRLLLAFLFALAGFFICWPFAENVIFPFLFRPLTHVMPEGSKLIFTSPPEAFFTYLKVAFVSGIFITCPLVFYQIWAFIAPGLYKEEKFYLLPVAFFSAFFFVCGGAFCYYVVFDFIFTFFMSYNQGLVQAMPKLDESLSFVLQLLLAFGLVFELPLFIFVLARFGIVTADKLRKFRRYAVLLAVIVGAVLTPPDVMSQLLMAAPLLGLYEVSIIIAAVFGRKTKETPPSGTGNEDGEEDGDDDEAPSQANAA